MSRGDHKMVVKMWKKSCKQKKVECRELKYECQGAFSLTFKSNGRPRSWIALR